MTNVVDAPETPHVTPPPSPHWPSRPRWFSSNRVRLERLRGTIIEMTESLEARSMFAAPDRRPALAAASMLLERASVAVEQGDLDTGWRLALEADVVSVAGDSADVLQARTEGLRSEMQEKMTGWRQSTAAGVLGKTGDAVPPEAVQHVMRLRNENSNNQYFKVKLVTSQLSLLGLLLASAIAAILVASYAGVAPLDAYTSRLAWAALLGAAGGMLSATRALTAGVRRKIPEQIADWPVTLTRPLIGATAGIGAWLFVQTGIVSVSATNADLAPLVTAFLAGFSERYFLSLVPGAGET